MIWLRVNDLKQHFYCARIPYYTYCVPVPRVVTHPMQVGSVEHEVLSVLERRRSLHRYGLLDGVRAFHVSVEAPQLGLTGVLDLLITTESMALPVEFKVTDQRLNLNAKVQVAAYAMMVEESLGLTVEHGFVYRTLSQSLTAVPISTTLRDKVYGAMVEIRGVIAEERIPAPPRKAGKCIECEFRRYCRDVL